MLLSNILNYIFQIYVKAGILSIFLLHLSQRRFLSLALLLLFEIVLEKCKTIINKIIIWIDVNNTK